MKYKVQMAINILIIIFMPFMMYINISNTKVNVAMSDMILVPVGTIFLINIKEFFLKKRWLYILYFAGLLLSLFLSQYISQINADFFHVQNSVMIMEMVKTFIVAMYFFTAFMFVKSERDFKLSLAAISLSSIPVIVIGLASYIYFLHGKDFFIDAYKIDTSRFLGSFQDPNLCAFYFILIFFVSLLNYKVLKNKFLRFLMLGISSFSLIVIVLTMSRGGWLALVGATIVYFLLNIKNFKKEILLMTILAVNIVLITVDFDYNFLQGKITNDLINKMQYSLSKNVDDIDRIQLMKTALEMGNDNFFFGVGKGSFQLNSYKYLSEDSGQYKMRSIPHNTILGFYSQQGIIGVLIFIILPGHILYNMIRSERKQNLYLIPLLSGLFIHSMTINIENVRFFWYIMGLILAAEKIDIHLDFISADKMRKRTFTIVLAASLLLLIVFYVDISRRMVVDIYVFKGDAYERRIFIENPGEYQLTFHIYSDDHLQTVEVYDDDILLKKMDFKSAYGLIHVPIHIEKECKLVFQSHEEGWMIVRNAYIIGDNSKIPLYNYVLLPRPVEDWLNRQDLLIYSNALSFKNQFVVEDNKLNAFELFNGKVTRYSNLSHVFQFIFNCRQRVDTNYQMELLLDYNSISSLLPNEVQRNLKTHSFTLAPYTIKWEEGQEYIVKSNRLFASEDFNLYGRYYDYNNKVYSQESYFPIQYDIVKEKQNIIELGESQWININYSKDNQDIIHMTNNGWVESGRMNLEKGDYNITFKAQGSFLEEYSKLRLRDSFLDEIAEITLDGTMKEYTIKYHTDKDQQGISFVLELINYKSEKGIGNRKVLLEDWLKVK